MRETKVWPGAGRWTLIGVGVAVGLYLVVVWTDAELFEAFVGFLWRHEHELLEVDEWLLPVVLFLGFALYDQVRLRRKQAVEREKLRVYRAMLSSAHHIVNNLRNQLLLVKMAAEETPGFPREELKVLDDSIREAGDQLEALERLEAVDESTIAQAVAPGSAAGEAAPGPGVR